MSEETFELTKTSEAEGKPVQYACIHIIKLKELGIKQEDIDFFISEKEGEKEKNEWRKPTIWPGIERSNKRKTRIKGGWIKWQQ